MSDCQDNHAGKINSYRVSENKELCKGIRKISVKGSMDFRPGQFAMLWIPGIGEKPFVPIEVKDKITFCVREKGEFTKKLCNIKKGDFLGIKGPLGTGFDYEGVKKTLLVGGGIGAIPLLLLAEELKKQGSEVDIITGAKCEDEVLFEDKFGNCGNHCVTTDDGSRGEKGFPTDLMKKMMEKKKYDKVYVCGPEIMMKIAMDYCLKKNVEVELSLERFMKCGFGICGQCALDNLLVCKDGPVFNGSVLATKKEFGRYAYNKAGKKVTLEEYYGEKK